MPYRYRCDQCAVETPPLRTYGAADAARTEHRDAEHGGLIPDHDRISYRTPHGPPPDWRVPAAAALLAVLWLIATVIHHL